MDKETVAVIIICLVAGYFAYAFFMEVERRKWYKRYLELDQFIDECENTRENWRLVTEDAREIRQSKLIKDTDMAALEQKISTNFYGNNEDNQAIYTDALHLGGVWRLNRKRRS